MKPDEIFMCDDNFPLTDKMRELAEKVDGNVKVRLLTYACAVDSALDDADTERFLLAHKRAWEFYKSLVNG